LVGFVGHANARKMVISAPAPHPILAHCQQKESEAGDFNPCAP
jgi:hypothetical protein